MTAAGGLRAHNALAAAWRSRWRRPHVMPSCRSAQQRPSMRSDLWLTIPICFMQVPVYVAILSALLRIEPFTLIKVELGTGCSAFCRRQAAGRPFWQRLSETEHARGWVRPLNASAACWQHQISVASCRVLAPACPSPAPSSSSTSTGLTSTSASVIPPSCGELVSCPLGLVLGKSSCAQRLELLQQQCRRRPLCFCCSFKLLRRQEPLVHQQSGHLCCTTQPVSVTPAVCVHTCLRTCILTLSSLTLCSRANTLGMLALIMLNACFAMYLVSLSRYLGRRPYPFSFFAFASAFGTAYVGVFAARIFPNGEAPFNSIASVSLA